MPKSRAIWLFGSLLDALIRKLLDFDTFTCQFIDQASQIIQISCERLTHIMETIKASLKEERFFSLDSMDRIKKFERTK
jgi:hypothetical protein